jgi:hypothetical protein
MVQRSLKNVNSCLETSGGQSLNPRYNVAYNINNTENQTSMAA